MSNEPADKLIVTVARGGLPVESKQNHGFLHDFKV